MHNLSNSIVGPSPDAMLIYKFDCNYLESAVLFFFFLGSGGRDHPLPELEHDETVNLQLPLSSTSNRV